MDSRTGSTPCWHVLLSCSRFYESFISAFGHTATVVTFVALLLSLSQHATIMLFASLTSFLAAQITLLAFACDIALFVYLRQQVNRLHGVVSKTTPSAGKPPLLLVHRSN